MEPVAFGSAPTVDLLSPTCLDSTLPREPGDRYLYAGFDWYAGDAPVRLVCDSDLGAGEMEFFLNGKQLPDPVRCLTYDPMNREADLAPFLLRGRNHIVWVQRAGNLPQLPLPYDGLRIFGDFHVEFPFGRPMPARLTPRSESYRTGFPVPASQMGHPHYGGLISYEVAVQLTGEVAHERVILKIERVFESMEVQVNGKTVGWIWSAPWHVEFPSELLRPGANAVTLICSCSPAAYLQGLMRPSGFLGPVRLYGV